MVGRVNSGLRVVVLLLVVLLTGCLQYDLDIQFDSQTHGRWVQQLHWDGGSLAAYSLQGPWLQAVSVRTQAVGGQVRWVADDSLELIVPFTNAADLQARFNQFFTADDVVAPLRLPGGAPVRANLSVSEQNYLLVLQTSIALDVDLTAVSPDALLPFLEGTAFLKGQVHLTPPWFMDMFPRNRTLKGDWPLTAGTLNHIEASFWIPSSVGMGGLMILLLVGAGYGIRYGFRKQSVP